jgi:hypothetical protein
MRKMLLASIAAAGAAMMFAAPAEAAQGCGAGLHRTPNGRCVPNRVVRGPHGRVVGVYYPGRGYWSDGRYWKHRYRRHGRWAYR